MKPLAAGGVGELELKLAAVVSGRSPVVEMPF